MTRKLHFLGSPPHLLPAAAATATRQSAGWVSGGGRGVGGIGGGSVDEDGVELGRRTER